MQKLNVTYSEYLVTYNEIISKAANSLPKGFRVFASPTFSKQETVTELYETIANEGHVNNSNWSMFKSALAFLPKLIMTIMLICYVWARSPKVKIKKNSVYFRSWLVNRSVAKDEIEDIYFKALPVEAFKDYSVLVGLESRNFKHIREFFYKNKKSSIYVIPSGLLSFIDIIKLFFDYLLNGYLHISKEFTLDGKNITNKINRSLLYDYLRLRSFTAYHEKYICRKLLKKQI